MKVRCKVTDYVGIVVVKQDNLHRVPQFHVQSKINTLGSIDNSVIFDEIQLEVIDKKPIIEMKVPKFVVQLGDCVQDSVTNFRGTMIARELHMNGCVRVKIRDEFKAGDKTSMSTATFDELSVKKVEQKRTVKPNTKNETRGCALSEATPYWD